MAAMNDTSAETTNTPSHRQSSIREGPGSIAHTHAIGPPAAAAASAPWAPSMTTDIEMTMSVTTRAAISRARTPHTRSHDGSPHTPPPTCPRGPRLSTP